MFPPKRTDKVTEWLERLLSTLVRGGLEVHENVGLDEDDNGGYSVKVKLMSPIPKGGWDPLKEYVKEYSLRTGWRVYKIRQEGLWLILAASRA